MLQNGKIIKGNLEDKRLYHVIHVRIRKLNILISGFFIRKVCLKFDELSAEWRNTGDYDLRKNKAL